MNFSYNLLQTFKSEKFLIITSIFIIFTYLLNFFTFSGDIVVYQHDNLDSNVAIYKLLADTGTLFSNNSTIIPNIMHGLPRAIFPSEYNVLSMLYYCFEPMYAYIINETFIRFIAFFGMFLLLKHHVIVTRSIIFREKLILIGTSLIFALLPYWSNGGASIAGQPLVLYAFLNLKKHDLSYKNWLILLLFPFYSSLILAGMFILSMFLLIFIHDWFKTKKFNYTLFLILFLMSMIYLFVEYRLVLNFIDPTFISHRQEFIPKYITALDAFKDSVSLFFKGQYHAHSLHGKILLPFILISWIIIFKNKIMVPSSQIKMARILFISIIIIALFGGFEDSQLFRPIKEAIPLLNQLQIDRFYFLFALLWFLLFALTAQIVVAMRWGIFWVSFVLILQITYSFLMQNGENRRKPVEFNRFYSQKVFQDAKQYISEPIDSYRIIHIGIEPSVGFYNGFYTLDGYLPNYPLEYKHDFRHIIAPELEKSDKIRDKFDNWGSRCQLSSTTEKIDLNLTQFKKMGGKYIFSSKKVLINDGKGVTFLQKFSDKSSYCSIYLYQVN